MSDLYSVLGLERSAKQEDIKKAYRAAVKKFHPDKHEGSPPNVRQDAAHNFKAVTEAYEVLGNVASRQRYDAVGGASSTQFSRSGGYTSSSYGYPGSTDWSRVTNPFPRASARANVFESFVAGFTRNQTRADVRLQVALVCGIIGTGMALDMLYNHIWESNNRKNSFKHVEELAKMRKQKAEIEKKLEIEKLQFAATSTAVVVGAHLGEVNANRPPYVDSGQTTAVSAALSDQSNPVTQGN